MLHGRDNRNQPPLRHGLGDVMPYHVQTIIGLQLGQPTRKTAYEIVINRQNDPVLASA